MIVINRSVDNPAHPRARTVAYRIVADIRRYVDPVGDIESRALLALPFGLQGAALLVLVGNARMDSCRVIHRACLDPDLDWDRFTRITFAGTEPAFLQYCRDVAR